MGTSDGLVVGGAGGSAAGGPRNTAAIRSPTRGIAYCAEYSEVDGKGLQWTNWSSRTASLLSILSNY